MSHNALLALGNRLNDSSPTNEYDVVAFVKVMLGGVSVRACSHLNNR